MEDNMSAELAQPGPRGGPRRLRALAADGPATFGVTIFATDNGRRYSCTLGTPAKASYTSGGGVEIMLMMKRAMAFGVASTVAVAGAEVSPPLSSTVTV